MYLIEKNSNSLGQWCNLEFVLVTRENVKTVKAYPRYFILN